MTRRQHPFYPAGRRGHRREPDRRPVQSGRGRRAPNHMHTREDDVFMLIKGSALMWCGDDEAELPEGASSTCLETSRTRTAPPPPVSTC